METPSTSEHKCECCGGGVLTRRDHYRIAAIGLAEIHIKRGLKAGSKAVRDMLTEPAGIASLVALYGDTLMAQEPMENEPTVKVPLDFDG